MHVVKRNGRREAVHFDKITSRITRLCYGLDAERVDPVVVASKVCQGVYKGVTTKELDELAAETAAHLSTQHPDYGVLAARIAVSNLHKSTNKSFCATARQLFTYCDPRTEKPAPMLADEVYSFIWCHGEELDAAIVYDRDFAYDYFGFKTLERSYLLRVNGEVAERPQHMLMRVACGLHCGDVAACIETYNLMSQRWFTHATPTLFNAGTPVPQLSSCYLLSTYDSIENIYDTLKRCALISKHAGGIGFSVSHVRATGSYIRGTNGTSNGLIPMLKVFNETSRYVDQGGGKRRGAFAAYVEPWHADIEAFLELRKNHGAEEQRARDLFQALWVPDLFMRRVEADEDWSLFCPNEAPGLADCHSQQFDALYESYERQPGKPRKVMKARKLWDQIIVAQQETGQPYMLYKDACNAKSNQKNLGTIHSSNLCVTGDTLVLTSKGHIPIRKLINRDVDVWNGETWSRVTPRQTGRDVEDIIRIQLSNGASINCTKYHKFYTDKGVEIRAGQLTVGCKLEKAPSWPVAEGADRMLYPYSHGLFCADGYYAAATHYSGAVHRCTSKATANGFCGLHQGRVNTLADVCSEEDTQCAHFVQPRATIGLQHEKRKLLPFLDAPPQFTSYRHEEKYLRIGVLLPDDIAPKFWVPINGDTQTKVTWFAGFVDGDGTVVRNGNNLGLAVVSINEKFLQDVRLMLQTMGVNATVGFASKGKECTILGSLCHTKDAWRLHLTSSDVLRLIVLGFTPHRLDFSNIGIPQREAKAFVKVVRIANVEGLHDTYCFDEPLRHRAVFNGILTGQCSEIVQFTSEDEVAVCNLASMALPMFVKTHTNNVKTFDHDRLFEVTRVVTRNLNKVVDLNYYPVLQALTSNRKHRPIGIGVQGLADVFLLLRLPFDSPEARQLNRDIFETIYYSAVLASMELAARDGAYDSYQGSPMSHGRFQFDLWGVTPSSNRWDWDGLRQLVERNGLRNSLLVAPMPTASTSQILGNNEAIEPYTSNVYVRRTSAGEFVCINRHLVNELLSLGLWTPQLKDAIVAANGSVQGIDGLSAELKLLYRTVWEIPQKAILDMAADRGAYICQSQSLNIHMANATAEKVTSMHFYGWKKGLKTGMYYLRTQAASDAIKFTLEPTAVCSLERKDGETCLSCSA